MRGTMQARHSVSDMPKPEIQVMDFDVVEDCHVDLGLVHSFADGSKAGLVLRLGESEIDVGQLQLLDAMVVWAYWKYFCSSITCTPLWRLTICVMRRSAARLTACRPARA